MGERGIGAAQRRRDAGQRRRKAFDVRFVNQGLVERTPQRAIVTPVELRIDHH
jgi:hypothetical protein